jgi:hypothetical protein
LLIAHPSFDLLVKVCHQHGGLGKWAEELFRAMPAVVNFLLTPVLRLPAVFDVIWHSLFANLSGLYRVVGSLVVFGLPSQDMS